ncbi:MAG: POTRA domain-containing protein, partial [Saprospiraceae bacterium]|nr:POTRA domain-containing protein [Saprospiraceae bacterium]
MRKFTALKYIGFLGLLISSTYLNAQEENPLFDNYISLDYENKKTYTIAQVNVVGTETRDTNAIKSIVKLREGDEIVLASDRIGRGVKSLWRLGIFSNVEILLDDIIDDEIYLTIKLEESPTLSRIEFKGVKKSWTDDLTSAVQESVRIGGILTQNGRSESIQKIKTFYKSKGFPDAEITIDQNSHPTKANSVIAVFTVAPKDRMKIGKISFDGNEYVSDRKLRKLMKETKKKGTIFKKSKFVESDFEEDKKNILAHYNKLGYRDATFLGDSLWVNVDNNLELKVKLSEGSQYVYRNISWKGNSLYTDNQLAGVLGIVPGDIYNEELLAKRLEFSLDGRDVSSLYMDNGYLFFQATPTELSVQNDSIDLEMRIYEGPQATIDKVSIAGNDRTNENVVRRTIRTVPGDKFSRSNIIRSQRELQNLGYFNPENMDIQTPVNPDRGTVDIEYTLEETPSDQLELSAGFGGFSGLIGTLGVSFN